VGGAAISALGNAVIRGASIHDNGPEAAVWSAGHLSISKTQLVSNSRGLFASGIDGEDLLVARHSVLGIFSRGEVSLTNSTVVDNYTGFMVKKLSLDHCTVVDNGGTMLAATLASHRSVVIASQTSFVVPICFNPTVIDSSSYNWFGDTSCALTGIGDHLGPADFRLGPLADNGGPFATRAPASGSVLIDQIPADACSVPVDTRGVSRPQGGLCDIGAVEVR
jgi:hypothetical protein